MNNREQSDTMNVTDVLIHSIQNIKDSTLIIECMHDRFSIEKFGDKYSLENMRDSTFNRVCDFDELLDYLDGVLSISSLDGKSLFDVRDFEDEQEEDFDEGPWERSLEATIAASW